MKTSAWVVIIVLLALILIGVGFMIARPGENGLNNGQNNGGNTSQALIRITTPASNALITSPLTVTGEARGNWYFEASFPVRLLDGEGNQIALGIAQAQGEWMTTEFVPFIATLTFANPTTNTGTLVLEKDNPSGLPEHDDQVRIPVRFEPTNVQTRQIRLYYYNESKDKNAAGNILCSTQGLEQVERQTPLTVTPIQDAVKLLLRGELTTSERARGITTEFPLSGLELRTASLSNNILNLTFVDPQNQTSGGSCRINILRAQIEATAKQFGGVAQVRLLPTALFQP